MFPSNRRIPLFCLFLIANLLIPANAAPDRGRIDAALNSMRIPFTENRGQTDQTISYYANTFAGTVYVTRQGELVYTLPGAEQGEAGLSSTRVIKEFPVDGKAVPAPGEQAKAKVSYFIGNEKAKWQNELNTYHSVKLGEVWDGIEVSFKAYGNNVEKLYTVAPGATVENIRMQVEGAQSLRVTKEGSLEVKTEDGPVRFTAPVAWQEIAGKRHPVQVAYTLEGKRYGFSLGEHDPAHAVLIDPLLQATYFGGGDYEYSPAISIHPMTGEVYVTGHTKSLNLPGVAGGVQAGNAGIYDFYIARFDPSLTQLLQATYLGGTSNEENPKLTFHPTTGEVYLLGESSSSNFPGTAGGAQETLSGGIYDDLVVVRLNASLTSLVQATYLGGSGTEYAARSFGFHPFTGELYVGGATFSGIYSNTDFPGTAGGAQASNGGDYDFVIARLNESLTQLLQATYLGGLYSDADVSIAIHPLSGEIYVSGTSQSIKFPGTTGGAQAINGGAGDFLVARLDASLTQLLQATYLGGSDYEIDAPSIAIHPLTGEVYLAGVTYSQNFPGTTGGAQTANMGIYDFALARLNADLTQLIQATYLGGSSFESYAPSIVILPAANEVYMAGFSASGNFPGTAGGVQTAIHGSYDMTVTRLNTDLTQILQSTFLGGGDLEFRDISMTLHPSTGEVYVAGTTVSRDFPGTVGGVQESFSGIYDSVIARLSPSLAANDYTLTTTLAGTGVGGVVSTDGRINCGADCSEVYGNFTNVTLTATPDAASTFTGWGGACSGAGSSCTVYMDAAKTVSATFNAITYVLKIRKKGAGTGSVTAEDGRINCGRDCSETYNAGTTVTLTAVADVGSRFGGWSGGCTGAASTCVVTLDAAKTVSAKFNLLSQ